MDYKIIINNKIIYMSKENYEKFIDEVPNTEFLNECEEISKLFSPQSVEIAKKRKEVFRWNFHKKQSIKEGKTGYIF